MKPQNVLNMDRPKPRAGIADIPEFPAHLFTPPPPDAILLNTNENRFGPSPKAIAALRGVGVEDPHVYPTPEALPLTNALAAKHGFRPSNVVAVGGGELLLPLILTAFAGPGDEVVYARDGFQKFRSYILTSGATAVPFERGGDLVDNIANLITPATKAVLLDNPGNPTGVLLSPATIRAIQARLPGRVLFILDEAYNEFSGFGDHGLNLARETANTLVLRTFSKAFGLAGLRIGWAAGQDDLMWPVRRIIPSFPIPRPSLAAALAALEDEAYLKQTIEAICHIRDRASERLRAAGFWVGPGTGNFLLLRQGNWPGAPLTELTAMLKADNIFVRLLPNFDGAPAIRLTIGTEKDMAHLFEAMGI